MVLVRRTETVWWRLLSCCGEVQPGKLAGQRQDGGIVSPRALLLVIEPTDEVILAVTPELYQPLPAFGIPRYPLEPRTPAATRGILLILWIVAWSQIPAFVVEAVFIDMIDPFAAKNQIMHLDFRFTSVSIKRSCVGIPLIASSLRRVPLVS